MALSVNYGALEIVKCRTTLNCRGANFPRITIFPSVDNIFLIFTLNNGTLFWHEVIYFAFLQLYSVLGLDCFKSNHSRYLSTAVPL